MARKIQPGESIFSTVIRETMPEAFTGNGLFANPKNPSLASMLEGIVTGGPDGEFLQQEMERRTGVKILPPDIASGKTLSLISPDCLPDDERYLGPRPWSEFVEWERVANARDLYLRTVNGLNPIPGLCRRCRRMCLVRGGTLSDNDEYVPFHFTDNGRVRFRPFGGWMQLLLRKDCSICRLVMSSLSCGTMILHPFLRKIDPEAQYSQIIPETLPSGENVLNIEYGLRKFGVLRMLTNENFRDILRQAYELEDVQCPFDRLRDPNSIFYDSKRQLVSVELLKRWITNCEEHHGSDCDQSWKFLDAGDNRPIFVIDVFDQCLVEKPMDQVRYIALSYVRGNTVFPTTKLANFKQRQSRMSLAIEDLPATVQDAITVAKSLNERFLWVDALCIVQDDLNSKHSDIRRMDAIYNHALVTLVALSGSSADAGLSGVRPGSRPPQHIECPPMGLIMNDPPEWLIERIDEMAKEDPKEHEFRLSANHVGTLWKDELEMHKIIHPRNRNADFEPPETNRVHPQRPWGMVAHPPSLKHIISNSPWDTRGWTMQERLLSRRCIYFSHNYVYFQCNQETLSETGGSLLTRTDVEVHRTNKKEVERAGITNPLLHFRATSTPYTIDSENHETMQRSQDFTGYAELIEAYSRRNLSFSSDILNAVAGMLKVMQDHIGGDLIAGIPAQYLDLVMMWTPAEPLDRTTPVGKGANVFPTWSWTAWTARKQFRLAHNSSGYDHHVKEFANSEIDCFAMLHRGELVEIFKTPDDLTATEIIDISTSLEPGRTLQIPKYVPYSTRRAQSVSGPDFGPNVLQFWAYTVDIESFQFADIEGTLISEPEHGNQRGEQYVNSLLDPRRKHCGLLFKPQSRSRYRGMMNKESMEYVLISSFTDSERRRYGIETIDSSVKPFDPHAFPWRGEGSGLVNVMLIEWFGDIAERFTVAQINRLAWERARPVKKHIRLV